MLDSIFPIADVYCKLVPLVRPYLTESLIRLNDKEVVFSCLVDPVPRKVWESVIGTFFTCPSLSLFLCCLECEQIDNLLHIIEKQRTIDKLGGGRHSFFSAGTSPDSMPQAMNRFDPSHSLVSDVVIEPIIKKLKILGMNEQIEDQLLSAQSLLKKLSASKRGYLFEDLTGHVIMNVFRDNITETLRPKPLFLDLPNARRMVFDLETGSHKYVHLKVCLFTQYKCVYVNALFDVNI